MVLLASSPKKPISYNGQNRPHNIDLSGPTCQHRNAAGHMHPAMHNEESEVKGVMRTERKRGQLGEGGQEKAQDLEQTDQDSTDQLSNLVQVI